MNNGIISKLLTKRQNRYTKANSSKEEFVHIRRWDSGDYVLSNQFLYTL